jgi:hypothetical protein
MLNMKRHEMVDGFDVDVGRLKAESREAMWHVIQSEVSAGHFSGVGFPSEETDRADAYGSNGSVQRPRKTQFNLLVLHTLASLQYNSVHEWTEVRGYCNRLNPQCRILVSEHTRRTHETSFHEGLSSP